MDLLKDSDRRTTSVQWPDEVDAHLDLLVRLAANEGILISRAQMLSALVADANLNRTVVAKIARRYLSQLKAGDLVRAAPPDDVLPAVRHRGRQRTPRA
ncbi:hypothetical protein [Actinoplanes regularis]|uniref:Uncharacterized protein n=1 Tax=Actinoplanes regularis TaxID=52697 RepID=A0A239I9U1_9ACTN|nr:hypothetical protein [Actinoplanes regularis]GIE90732.1 hypothetical protein Are01nite_72120 [Actinoplanes regularis]SNS90345.1 hypothetical protein SAMN06264365_12814 [Actinoplanes regularis]